MSLIVIHYLSAADALKQKRTVFNNKIVDCSHKSTIVTCKIHIAFNGVVLI